MSSRADSPAEPVQIRGDMIRLGQFLKLAGVVTDGSQARDVIESGAVSVNGQVETRRGRQLHAGAEVGLASQRLVVVAE